MKTYTAHDDAEAARLAALEPGQETLLVVPCQEQPVGNEYAVMLADKWHMGRMRDSENAFREMSMPFSPGEVVGVKEAFRCTGGGGWKGILYRANGADTAASFCGINDGRAWTVPEEHWPKWDRLVYETRLSCKWRPARTMPYWVWHRSRLLILSNEARMVGSITEKEAEATGVERERHGGREFDWRDYSRPDGCSVISAEASFKTLWHRRHPNYPFETAWAWFIGAKRR